MPAPADGILLIDGGDLPSLTALMLQPDGSRVVIWHRRGTDPAAPRREAMARTHHELLGARALRVTAGWSGGAGAAGDDPWKPLLLIESALIAAREHCARIVWPVQVGLDAKAVLAAADLSTLVADLTRASPPPGHRPAAGEGLAIELPLVDLEPEQVVDLADEAGAPPEAFWPCDTGEATPCGACAGCVRWQRAYEARGLAAPWLPAAV